MKSNGYIVPSSTSKEFALSQQGVQLASTFASAEELEMFKVPDSNEELHDKIKSKLARVPKAAKYGPKILDFMAQPDYQPRTRHQLAALWPILTDSFMG